MHELSIVMGILDIAAREAGKAGATCIEEIELDIGELSTVDMDAFDFAWQQGLRDTILSASKRIVNHIQGKAICLDCETVFPLHALFDPCPNCTGHLLKIQQGKELRVKCLVVKTISDSGFLIPDS